MVKFTQTIKEDCHAIWDKNSAATPASATSGDATGSSVKASFRRITIGHTLSHQEFKAILLYH